MVIALLDTLTANGTILTNCKRNPVDNLTLVSRWLITPVCAKLTIDRMTQRCVKTRDDLTLSRRFQTNDQQLQYT